MNMKEIAIYTLRGFSFFMIEVLFMLGIRAVEYIIDKPAEYYYVCIQDNDSQYQCDNKKYRFAP